MFNRFKASHIGLVLILVMAWFAYLPGLSGPFLFDDFANLPTLGADGPVQDWSSFVRYVTSGVADPTGRPIALLTFLIDAHNWPADPYPFKRTNVVLHLLNGALLFFLLCRLGTAFTHRYATPTSRTRLAALLATSVWLLHPFFVSTTLYIVQREAMLPATFILLGLIGWMDGRARISDGHLRSGLVLACTSLVVCTLLGALSKANGILLPAFVLALEFGILRRMQPMTLPSAVSAYRIVLSACTTMSVVIATGLLYLGASGLIRGIGAQRPWTLGERLITEPRVLWDYLGKLWLPHPYTAGVFNDQIDASTSLLHPWTTLPALLGVVGLVGTAVMLRRRSPALSTAIVFFFAGHAIESTTIPLELYFEHRNYVPALLMFWPFALWLCGVSAPSTIISLPWTGRLMLSVAILAGLGWMTYSNAKLWGDGQQQARLWAVLNPKSPRAQVNAAQSDLAEGRPADAIARLQPLLREHPEEVQIALNLVAARCSANALEATDIDNARVALLNARDPGTLLVSWFNRAIADENRIPCHGLDLDALSSLANAGADNPNFPDGRRQDFNHIQGLIALRRHDPVTALAAFDRALALDPRPGAALEQAAMLGSAGYPTEGLKHLATFDALTKPARPRMGMPFIHAWILDKQHYWRRERERLETTLQNDMKEGATSQ